MNSTIQKSDDQTIILTMTLPWTDVQSMYQTVLTETVSSTEIAGFRKGKAPKTMVEDNIDKTKVYEETIRRLVPKAYTQAITDHKLSPIMMPQVELKEAQEGKDWVIEAKTCERPTVSLGDYKKAIRDMKANKTPKIIVPGMEPAKDSKEQAIGINDVLDAILSSVTSVVPDILLEHEVTHQLSQLVDQTKKLGLTVEQYLSSTGKSAESIRKEYKDQANKNITLEFALDAIAEKEGVSVEDSEVSKFIASAKTPEEAKNLENQRYYLTSLLRRQKTIDKLMV